MWYFDATTLGIKKFNISLNTADSVLQAQSIQDTGSLQSWKICKLPNNSTTNTSSSLQLQEDFFLLVLTNQLIIFSKEEILKEEIFNLDSKIISTSDCS